MLDASDSMGNRPPIVLSLHGIRTRGAWQKGRLSQILGAAGFLHIPLDYDRFTALQLLLPGQRRKKVRWFWDQYSEFSSPDGPPPHLIAHSFGTYIACEALRINGEIRFSKLILCGSIVHPRFPWTEVFAQRRVEAVLNDYGTADRWTRFVGFAIADGGPSGATGFSADGPIVQRRLEGWGHSDFFYRTHFTSWLRFLLHKDAGSVGVSGKLPVSWQAWVGRVFLLALVVALAMTGAMLFLRPTPVPSGQYAVNYGTLASAGVWTQRNLLPQMGDCNEIPSAGDIAITPQPISGYSNEPRGILAIGLSAPRTIESGERLLIREVRNKPLIGVWALVTIMDRPADLQGFRYIYRYIYANVCPGFMLSNGHGAWAEYTPGDGDCAKTLYMFSEVAQTSDAIYLFDGSRGYYVKLPRRGGIMGLSHGTFPAGKDIRTLQWDRHYLLARLDLLRKP